MTEQQTAVTCWTECLFTDRRRRNSERSLLIGILRGEGIGGEVLEGALEVLNAVTEASGLVLKTCEGGCIGREAERSLGTALAESVVEFCKDVFARGGAVVHGPGGGRFVYDLRKRLELFLKISPLHSGYGALDASSLKPNVLRDVDIIITRENLGGVYQGAWEPIRGEPGRRVAAHTFSYAESQVSKFLNASARLAKQRRADLTVVWKEAGIPSISELWRERAKQVAAEHKLKFRMVDIDLIAYQVIREPQKFDVIAAPNLFGDVLADLGAALLGSRGIAFSGNYSEAGHAVYQTNHGAAYDLAGTDRANPGGQILALAMMLRESFGLEIQASAIETAIRSVWNQGWRTEDIAVPGSRIVGTRQMSSLIAEQAAAILESKHSPARACISHESTAYPR